jgi:maleylpyruvate isomerase
MTAQVLRELVLVRASTDELLTGLAAEHWSDADIRQASLLPDWTRGHVLTHIARNADGITRTVSAALRGEQVDRYPRGPEGRAADIEAGAHRSAGELLADVRDSAYRLDQAFTEAQGADGWELPTGNGHLRARVASWLPRRWREVEIHRVDLAGTYSARQWPAEFVDYLLPEVAATLPKRIREPVRVAVAADGSVGASMIGRSWTAGTGDAVPVRGPDWAVLAWLLGRPAAAMNALSAMPELTPWL